MSNYDPNFPNRDPEFNPLLREERAAGSGGWGLTIGAIIVVAFVALLAFGRNHSDQAMAPGGPGMAPTTNSAVNTTPATPGAILPAPRNPTETTGSAPRQQ
jgi:hypothetical protein